ncbi:MAG: hypothetical protein CMA77_02040 [Euryarchaeota archaeon]|nr:hypothetical protein [Euryarchaeota archaeon]
MASPYWVMMGIILILTPVICWLFTAHKPTMRTPLRKIGQMIHDQRYYLHIMGYIVIIVWKGITDKLNEPIKTHTGHWTDIVYGLEGEIVLWIQQAFENPSLTAFLNFHYLFIYLFLIYVTTVYFAFSGERDMTDKVTLNYLLIYAIAVPYYLFFNVEVTSSWIPGMDALLYHDGTYTSFYVSHDPLDNAVPSLHVAIPFGILLLNWLHVKEKGVRLRDWEHWRYHVFIAANTILFMFSILYLGIHWIIDIPLGMAVGGIGALFIHQKQPRLRNGYGTTFRGFTKKKWKDHILVEGLVGLLLLAAIVGALSLQDDRMDEVPSFRLGPGDSTYDIVQQISFHESVEVSITNWGDEQTLEVLLIVVQNSENAMVDGEIDWEQLSSFSEVTTIVPGDTIKLTVDQPKVWTLVVLHHPGGEDSGILEVAITNQYPDNASLTSAYLLSIPSLWITGNVVYRLVRVKKSGMEWYSSLPSHTWSSNEESE